MTVYLLPNQLFRINILISSILRPQREVPWMVGIKEPKASPFLPTIALVSNYLCPMLTSPKHLSPAKIITMNISVNRMARRLEGNIQGMLKRKM
jgi:hypothetical protein